MIDPRTKLNAIHDDNGSFTDYKDEAVDYLRDSFNVTMVSAEDKMYFGFRKPFGAIYFELETPNLNSNSFSAAYWDGTQWVTLSLNDETQGWTRSGFMTWNKELMDITTIDGTDAYFLRLVPSADHTATSIRGANLVFSDDQQLKQEFSQITNSNMMPAGQTSHIQHHVASRNRIVQELRNRGNLVQNATTGALKDLDQWDLHDVYEVRQAATHLALSKIFFELSDEPDDQWWMRYREHKKAYESNMALAALSLDTNDDGTEDTSEEKTQVQPVRWNR